jgi:hypothetical protein
MEHASMTDDTLMTAEPVRTAALRRWLREQEDEIRLLRGLLRECSPLILGDPVCCLPSSQLVDLDHRVREALGDD